MMTDKEKKEQRLVIAVVMAHGLNFSPAFNKALEMAGNSNQFHVRVAFTLADEILRQSELPPDEH